MKDFSIYKARRERLAQQVASLHTDSEHRLIVLFGAFESECAPFRQDSTFFYFTGIEEPGLAFVIDAQAREFLYVPNCQTKRMQWVKESVDLSPAGAQALQFDSIELLGKECAGYQLHRFCSKVLYESLIARIADTVDQKGVVCSTVPDNECDYVEQRFLWMRLQGMISGLQESLVDISPTIAHMRRIKERPEIENTYRAIETTSLAQEAAARAIGSDVAECEVQAHLEFIMTGSCARIAFPSIVGSGPNSTVLHYTPAERRMQNGDVVVIDIGAEYGNYCADITRTYPVSGTFTDRQREIYTLVLDTQEYIASIAKPGYWLSNKDQQDKSLNHLAREFLAGKGGYDKYFPHGIGHFLGLDVHDVGDVSRPLESGDVITIEPGIYIAEEEIGVRIEDNYWVVEDGVVCISEQIPKSIPEVEAMVQADLYGAEQEQEKEEIDS